MQNACMKSRKYLRILIVVVMVALAVVLAGLAKGADQTLSVLDEMGVTLGGSARYGSAMAASGDWLAVGAPGQGTDNQGRYTGGRVLLWKRVEGIWSLRQMLTWPDQPYWPDLPPWPSSSWQRFGERLAMDGGRLLVGSSTYPGRIHAFRLEEDSWVLDGKIEAQDEIMTGRALGGPLLIAGDLAVVGCPDSRLAGQLNRGWVDIFQRQPAGWVRLGRIIDSDADVADLGRSISLRGDTIYAGIRRIASNSGRVAVFVREGAAWIKTTELLAPETAPSASALFGEQVQAVGDRLFVTSGGTEKQVFEYDISAGYALVSQTPCFQGASCHVQGDTMIQVAPNGLMIYRRQLDQSWIRDVVTSWGANGLSQVYSGILVNGDVLLGGEQDILTGATQTLFKGTVMVARRQADRWVWPERLAPQSADQIRAADFGRSVAVSEPWLVVGSPSKVWDGNRQAGMAFVYRRLPDGKFRYHSVLPEPVFSRSPTVDLSGFGSRVVISGGWAAVTMSADPHGYSSDSRVILYAYDAGADVWRQAPGDESGLMGDRGFGDVLAMEGDLLAVSVPRNGVNLYRLTGTTWSLEATVGPPASASSVSGFAASLALDGGRLLVGAPQSPGGAAYLFEKKGARWTQTAQLKSPATVTDIGGFGQTVSLSGGNAIISHGGSSQGLVTPFKFTSGSWKAQPSLTSALTDSYPRSSAMTDSVAVMNDGHSLSVYMLQQSRWTAFPDALSPSALGSLGQDRLMISSGGVTISGSQVIAGANGTQVRILDLVRAPAISFGLEVSPVEMGGAVEKLDAGEYFQGADIRQFAAITATHQGIVPVRLGLQISGGGDEFTLGTGQITLEPNQKSILDLRFRPGSTGLKTVSLTVTTDIPYVVPRTYVLQARVVAAATALQLTQVPVGGIYEVGDAPRLEYALTGTLPWTFRWFKDGRVISGETAPFLQPAAGGTYRVEVTNPHGKVLSDPIPLGLYRLQTPEVVVLSGGTARGVISVSGPVKVRWGSQDAWLEDGPSISGAKTPVLTLKNVRPLQGLYAEIMLSGREDQERAYCSMNLNVVSPPEIISSLDDRPVWLLGQEDGGYFAVDYDGPQIAPPVYRVRGLPVGLTVDEAGGFSGVPEKAGEHTIHVTATVDGFTTAKVYRMTVSTTTQPPGIYWGWLQATYDLPSAGAVMLDLQSSGAYSAVIYTGSTRTSIAGTLSRDDDIHPSIRRFPVKLDGKPQVCWAQSAGFEPKIAFLVRDAATPNQIGTVVSELLLIRPSNRKDTVGSAGHYTFGLMNRSFNGLHMLEGNGFGTLKVDIDGRATYAGQLADGSSVTGSTWLSDASMDGGQAENLYFYQADTKTGAVLRGAAPLTVPDTEESPYIEWQRPARRGRLYAEGIDPRPVAFIASRYTAPKNTPLLPRTAHWIRFEAPGTYVGPVPFKLTRQHKAVFGAGEANPNKVRLDIHAPTGFFTGQFTVRDQDPQNPSRTLIRTAPYRGILLQDREEGVGYFLLPSLPDPDAEPPTTLKTSPIISGSVLVESLDDL